jgi:hypothetical protein
VADHKLLELRKRAGLESKAVVVLMAENLEVR